MNNVCIALLTAIIGASPAVADFIVEDVPSWRGDANSSLYDWQSFTSASAATGPNVPTNEAFPSGDAVLFNFSSGAIVSGEGNIYGFGGPLNVHGYVYAASDVQQVVANISMHGTELLYDQVVLAWTDGIADGAIGVLFADVSYNYLEEVDFGGGIGMIANVSYAFDLSSVTADIREIGVLFQTAGAHSSLDAVAIDVLAIPAPGAVALLGLAGLAGRRRRRA
jgi:hypothetical protein